MTDIYETELSRAMEKVREVARECARSGLTIVIGGAVQDPLTLSTNWDYAIFGDTMAGIGLINALAEQCKHSMVMTGPSAPGNDSVGECSGSDDD